VVGFVWSFGKSLVLPRYYNWDVVKTRQASHGLTETHQKGHWKIMLQGGERDEHTLFEITGLVQMAKSDPVAQAKSSLSNCTWLERWVWVLILNHLETSNASREQGSFIYYFFFLSLSHYIYTYFPLLFLSFILFSFSLFFIFLYSPWTLDYIVPISLATPPMLIRLHVLGQRGGNFFMCQGRY
jgi:hypothetical protein